MAPILTDCCAAAFCAVHKATSAAPSAATAPLCKNIPPPQAHAAFDNSTVGRRFASLTVLRTMAHEKLAGPRRGMAWARRLRREATARGFPRWAVTGRFVRLTATGGTVRCG